MSRFCTLALSLCITLGFALLVCSVVLVPNHLALGDDGSSGSGGGGSSGSGGGNSGPNDCITCTFVGVGAPCVPTGYCFSSCIGRMFITGPFCFY